MDTRIFLIFAIHSVVRKKSRRHLFENNTNNNKTGVFPVVNRRKTPVFIFFLPIKFDFHSAYIRMIRFIYIHFSTQGKG